MSYNDELYHWGIKGMKWGIRRFQKKDGTLTALGKKRKRDDDSDGESKPKSVKDMSDAELRSAISRLEMENRYRQLNPEKVSMGQKFMNSFKDRIVPELSNVGSRLVGQYLEKKGKQLLGLSDDDSLAGLKKEVEKLKLTKEKLEITDKIENFGKNQGGKKNKNKNQNSDNNNQPKKDDSTSQPKKDNSASQPKKDDSTSQPKKDNSASQPKKDNTPVPSPKPAVNSSKPSLSDIANSGYRMKNTDYIENRGYDYGFKFTNRTSRAVGKLADSGYKMSNLETLSGEKKTNLGKTHLSDIINSGWKMTSLDDIERRGYRK